MSTTQAPSASALPVGMTSAVIFSPSQAMLCIVTPTGTVHVNSAEYLHNLRAAIDAALGITS